MKKNAVFEDVLVSVTRYFIVLVIGVLLFILLSGVRFVKSGEVALVLRFGKLMGNTPEEQVHEPGILFALPYIIDEVVTVPTGSVMDITVDTHFTEGAMTEFSENGYVITGDNNVALVSAAAKYTISDPVAYALRVNDVEKIINASISNAMLEEAAYRRVDDILTSGKEEYASKIMENAQAKLNAANTGVTLQIIELTNVAMPREVRAVYENVNAASVEAKTELRRAEQYRESLLPAAQSSANTLIAEANIQQWRMVSAAESDLAEFWGVLEEYEKNPELVKTRIYNDKMTKILKKIGRIRVVQDGDSYIVIN